MLKSKVKNIAMLLHAIIPDYLPRLLTGDFAPIFMLHRFDHPDFQISGINTNELRIYLEFFRKNGYHAITLEALVNTIINNESLPPKTAVFTIDDGFIDQFDIAAPIFSEYDIPLTFFLITNFIERKIWPWDDQISFILGNARFGKYEILMNGKGIIIDINEEKTRRIEIEKLRAFIKSLSNNKLYDELESIYQVFGIEKPTKIPNKYLPMTWDNARELSGNGHKIAAHTTSHRILSRLSAIESSEEIRQSIRKINDEIDDASPVFAYPTGRYCDFTEREINYLQQNDILATVSTLPGSVILHQTLITHMHSLPRFPMPNNMFDFVQYLSWMEVLKNKMRSYSKSKEI